MPYQERHVETLPPLVYGGDTNEDGPAGSHSAEQRLIRMMLAFGLCGIAAAVVFAAI